MTGTYINANVKQEIDSFSALFYKSHGVKISRSGAIHILLDRNKKYQELIRKLKKQKEIKNAQS